jgi:[acyl-carrier-protein] S-malonyltransferase
MNSFALIFPGQGSQFAGMGKALVDQFPEAKATFQEADDALGFPLSNLCFNGPDDELKLTQNTQPAIVTTSVAALRVLQPQISIPSFVAGHSLGEYAALVAARSLTFSDAVKLVRIRGQYMQQAVAPGIGAMAAILKLPEGSLDQILQDAAQGEIVSAANYNSPDQVVISGHKAAVERAMEAAKTAGAKRTVLLPVSAPFHCPLMLPAQEKLAVDLTRVAFDDLAIPLINNVEARIITSGTEARTGLIKQVSGSVLWTQTIRYLASQGIKTYVEVGPGKVLAGLVRAIDPEASVVSFGEPAQLDEVIKLLQ